jgi:hypothetical protein
MNSLNFFITETENTAQDKIENNAVRVTGTKTKN